MLSIKNLHVKRDDKVILDNISFSLEQGEFLSLVGPSGCGKSTLLHSIMGFLSIDGGSIHYNDQDLSLRPVEKRRIGIVFQDNSLFPNLNVIENVTYGISHLPKSEREAKAYELLELVNLSDYALKMPHQLSGGQKQRVAIIRALATSPNILLLDECFSSLDEKMRAVLRTEVKQLLRKLNITCILVTHDKNEAINFSSKVAVLGEGKIQQLGCAPKLLKEPANVFVAQFFGNGNVVGIGQVIAPGYYPKVMISSEGSHEAIVDLKEFIHGRYSYRLRIEDGNITFNEVLCESEYLEGQSLKINLGECHSLN